MNKPKAFGGFTAFSGVKPMIKRTPSQIAHKVNRDPRDEQPDDLAPLPSPKMSSNTQASGKPLALYKPGAKKEKPKEAEKELHMTRDSCVECRGGESNCGTLFREAIAHGREEEVVALLEKHQGKTRLFYKIGLAEIPEEEPSPIGEAARLGHTAVLQKIFERNSQLSVDPCRARLEPEGPFGMFSPLYLAARGGHAATVKMMLQFTTNQQVSATLNGGQTPLYAAAVAGHLEVVETLLQQGVPVNQTILAQDATPLHGAVVHNRLEVVKKLLEAPEIDKEAKLTSEDLNFSGATALHLATREGLSKIMLNLLKAGANPDSTDAMGRTALHLAVILRLKPPMDLLLAKSANVDIADNEGYTALHHACKVGNHKAVEALLSAGAPINVAEMEGRSALHIACTNSTKESYDILRLLLMHGADVESENLLGESPLMAAVTSNQPRFVDHLLRCGADRFHRSAVNQTPMSLAREESVSQTVRHALTRVPTLQELAGYVVIQEFADYTQPEYGLSDELVDYLDKWCPYKDELVETAAPDEDGLDDFDFDAALAEAVGDIAAEHAGRSGAGSGAAAEGGAAEEDVVMETVGPAPAAPTAEEAEAVGGESVEDTKSPPPKRAPRGDIDMSFFL